MLPGNTFYSRLYYANFRATLWVWLNHCLCWSNFAAPAERGSLCVRFWDQGFPKMRCDPCTSWNSFQNDADILHEATA